MFAGGICPLSAVAESFEKFVPQCHCLPLEQVVWSVQQRQSHMVNYSKYGWRSVEP